MIVLFVGTPGSGKGTQADLVSEKFNLYHFSTGEVFREMSGPESEEIDAYMKRGDLVPDEIVIKVFKNYLENKKLYDNLIIDGSPRSLYQYKKFKEFFNDKNKSISAAFFIKISDDEAVKRLTARREDIKTHEIYNLITNPPGPEVNESDLIQREDDTEVAVRERLRVQKVPDELLAALKEDGILHEIDGERLIDVIFNDISEKLKVIEEKNDK